MDVETSAFLTIEIDDAGWNKEGYISGEIAIYVLSSEHQLTAGKAYKWRAKSYDGIIWSNYTDYFDFNVLTYVGGSDVGIFFITADALDAMKPQLLSVGDSLPENETNNQDGAVIINRIPVLTWSIPYGLGTGVHFRLEVDVVNTFDSRNILKYESKYAPALFSMYDGVQWKTFLETGTIFGAEKVKIVLPDTYFNDTYYWRVIPAI